VVDFGQQLYTAWQLSQGKALYRDVAFYNGPLSQYANAAWFRLFGVSLRTLVLANLAIGGVLTVLLHAVLRRAASRRSAAAGCLVFVLLFAFAGFTQTGNYNYLCPYSHEMTHGVLLSLLSLLGVWGYGRFGLRALAGAGLALGLAFLTKAEVFVAAAAGSASALALTIWTERPARGRALAMAGWFVGAAAVPPAAAWALLCLAMPASRALAGTLGSWVVVSDPLLRGQPFFQDLTGLSNLPENLALLLRYAGCYAAVLVPAGLIAFVVRRRRRWRAWAALGVFCATAALLTRLTGPLDWVQAARPLPLLMLAAGIVLLLRVARCRRDPEARRRALRQASLVILALALLSKMILAVWIGHYGFVLAMPASLVLVVLLLEWLPAAVSRMGGEGAVPAAAGAGMLLAAVVALLSMQGQRLKEKTCEVMPGTADAFRSGPIGQYINDFVTDFSARASPGQTLAVLPEGAMLNFLCRRESPVPYANYLPLEVALWGEPAILQALQSHPPDWIALTNRSTAEYGLPWFSRDYGVRLGQWIARNYARERSIGGPLLQDRGFGILLLMRVP
jgi:4-amino-4-deoxy-L-arabinose transferase-like glycosyltransferase